MLALMQENKLNNEIHKVFKRDVKRVERSAKSARKISNPKLAIDTESVTDFELEQV